ncbi:DNA polymerase delta catalytic subunit-like [Diaphorina citri]|uniref:DNA polymerase delta catalytic subunit n=1 Tax=Diaphorina citri TaxID=121845 RepID=A0A3Q0J709_DIACI|nr:DNA polymerase delta catalytic subunit-like [Diaphorina citri]
MAEKLGISWQPGILYIISTETICFCFDISGPECQQTSDKWSRAPPPELNPKEDKIVFQQISIEHYTGEPIPGMPGSQLKPVPIVRMFGVTMEGNSVCCHVHGFSPYLYVSAPKEFNSTHCRAFKEALNRAIIADMRGNKDEIQEAVLMVEIVQKQTVFGFWGEELENFLKITVALPKLVAGAKRLLEKESVFPTFPTHTYKAFESNIDFDIRFMVDNDIVGCNWIEIPPGKWQLRGQHKFSNTNRPCVSRCQLEIDVSTDDIVSHAPEGEWSKVAPLRILSFDIECAGRKGIFPDPNHDPIIQIANMCISQGASENIFVKNVFTLNTCAPIVGSQVICCKTETELLDKWSAFIRTMGIGETNMCISQGASENIFVKNVFTLNTCAPIVGSQVICCKTETELLDKWSAFIRELDPDIFTGYNIQNFDFPYLINRAKHLGVKNFTFLGRVKDIRSVIKDSFIQSKQMGKRENKTINFEGRVCFDLLFVLLREYKLRSYTLNSVSYHFLQEQKEDVQHSIISDLQAGTPQTRRRLAVYCLKDAYLRNAGVHENKAESILLRGDHTRTKIVSTSRVGALSMFVQKKQTCIGCKVVLHDTSLSNALCNFCLAKEKQYYEAENDKYQQLEKKFCQLWTQCQTCQGSLHEQVICTSRDCPIFYMRKKVQSCGHNVKRARGVCMSLETVRRDNSPLVANMINTCLETVRRDNSPLVANMINTCLQKLLINRDPDGAVTQKNFIIPTYHGGQGEDQFEGATVIEPKKGYYADPIATLDFSSLYPSIMMAHNLCYTTLLTPQTITKLELTPDQYSKTPCGNFFLKSSLRKGLLPEILENLLSARKQAKNDLKKETDEFKKKVLDGRQLALKISANSVYGFTGAQVGKLPCQLWTQCQTCQGSLHEQVICTSRDCPIFYMRKKVQIELISQDQIIQRFGTIAW